jgi:hypothetical protein
MKKLILLAAIIFSAAVSNSQKISTLLNFPKGAKIEVNTTIESVAEVMGEITTKASATRTLDVEDVKEGVATLESKVKRVQFSFEGMGQSQSFDSENESDMKGEGGKMAEKALKNKYSMQVDQQGKIISVKADDDNPNVDQSKAEEADPMMGMMQGVMGGMELPKAGDKIEFAIFPDQDIVEGQTWTDTTTLVKDIHRNAKYFIKSITAENIEVSITEETKGKFTRQNMGMEITIDQVERSTGTILVDRKTGLMKERNITKTTEGTMEVMGQSMPLNTRTSIKEVVTVR